jgi:hypothetical protein
MQNGAGDDERLSGRFGRRAAGRLILLFGTWVAIGPMVVVVAPPSLIDGTVNAG